MEMVSASKMRRAQEMMFAGRPYADQVAALISGIAASLGPQDEIHPLLDRRPANKIGLILVTPDRGLCGALPGNVIRLAEQTVAQASGSSLSFVTMGRKGRTWMLRRGFEVVADLSGLKDRPSLLEIQPAARVAISGYTDGTFDRVDLIYTDFISTSNQRPRRRQLLPVEIPDDTDQRWPDFLFEPTPYEVLSQLLPRYIEVLIYQAVLEAQASEHSARMIAMHNATENARELVQELTLSYNNARQASITNEILEIAAGAETLRDR
jgi:F-type H+-transporting ATPase subunit gamma